MPDEYARGREPTNDLFEAVYTQRAIRYWQSKPVPRDVLAKVVEAATKAPSGSNTQPWVFVAVDGGEPVAAIASALRAFAEADEQLSAVIASAEQVPDKSLRLILKGARNFFLELERAPALVVPCLYRLASPTEDPTSLLAGSSIYMAVQNLMLAARALGLGTLMTTAHQHIEPDLRKILALPDDAFPVALIPIGYPDANFGPTRRKPLAEILRWNDWGTEYDAAD